MAPRRNPPGIAVALIDRELRWFEGAADGTAKLRAVPPGPGQRSEARLGLVAAVLGGASGWIAAFSGLGLWGLAIGLAVTVIVLFALAREAGASRSFAAIAGFGFAFVLLTWPLLWLLIGYIRYAITGESLGD